MSAAGTTPLSLTEACHYLIDECRMVLPGIQALFGFQLIAVFNQRFDTDLTHGEQCLHLMALLLVATAAALVMAPASYHRESEPHSVSEKFFAISSRLLLFSLFPLMTGIAVDVYLIARMILRDAALALVCAGVLFLFIAALWFLLPWRHGAFRRRR